MDQKWINDEPKMTLTYKKGVKDVGPNYIDQRGGEWEI